MHPYITSCHTHNYVRTENHISALSVDRKNVYSSIKIDGRYMAELVEMKERRCLSVVSEPFGQEHKVEIIPLLVLPLITNASNFLEAGPRGVGTAKREGSNALWQKAFNKHL